MARLDWNRKDQKYLVVLKDADDNEIESRVLIGDNCYDIGETIYDEAAKDHPGLSLEIAPAEWDADTLARVKEIELKQNKKKKVKKA